MESLASARKKIEFYQLMYLKKAGLSQDEIQNFSLNSTKIFDFQFPGRESKANILREKIKKIKDRFEITKYENLVLLPEIIKCWDNLAKANDYLIEKSEAKYGVNKIAIGTAPTGDFNAKSILGQDNSVGILLESNIYLLFITLSRILVRFIVSEKEDRIEFNPPNSIRKNPNRFKKEIIELCNLLIALVIEGRIREENINTNVSDDLNRLCSHFEDGIISFVLGHELGHILKKHHSLIKLKRFVVPNDKDELRRIFEKHRFYYSEYEIPDDKELLLKYSRHHFEYEADYLSFFYCSNAMRLFTGVEGQVFEEKKSYQINVGQLLYLFGTSAFLVFLENLEKAIRVIRFGERGIESPLFSKDIEVQNILFRQNHPSPVSRINFLKSNFNRGKKIDPLFDMIEEIFDVTWWTLYPNLLRFHDEKYDLHDKWKYSTNELNGILNLY